MVDRQSKVPIASIGGIVQDYPSRRVAWSLPPSSLFRFLR